MKKHITPRVAWSLFAIAALLVAQAFGYTASADEMTAGGLMLAGIGEIELKDINTLIEKQGRAFEEFKSFNNKRYSQLEKEMVEILKKGNRPGARSSFGAGDESKSDLGDFLRGREVKSMQIGSGPDGGFLMQPYLHEGIGTIVRNTSALRELVNVMPMETGSDFVEVISTTPAGVKWVGETEARPATDNPQLAQITTTLHEHYAEPVISQRLVDDSSLALVDFLINETALAFAEAEELALFYGTGLKQPWGLDTFNTTAQVDGAREWGTMQHIPTGAAGAFAATDPFDCVKKLFYSLRAGYRSNAKWVCNSEMALELSTLKDGNDNYLWSEGSVKEGTPATLLGRPVVICETTPSIAADAKPLWFGDWNQGLRVIERPGNKLLLDPYTDKPNLKVYVYRRFGIGLRNSNAIKCLKFSAS